MNPTSEEINWIESIVKSRLEIDSSESAVPVHHYRLRKNRSMADQINITHDHLPRLLQAISQDEDNLNQEKVLLRLRLYLNPISFQGCKHLIKSQWNNLQALDLGKCSIGEKGCKHLSKGRWPKLKFLVLDGNTIGNKGCSYLTRGNWPHLHQLYLQNNHITSQGSMKLAAGEWYELVELILYNNEIGKLGFSFLDRHLNCQVLCEYEFRVKP